MGYKTQFTKMIENIYFLYYYLKINLSPYKKKNYVRVFFYLPTVSLYLISMIIFLIDDIVHKLPKIVLRSKYVLKRFSSNCILLNMKSEKKNLF